MNLGERLLNLRKAKHLSQEEVADKLNVTRQTVSKWETDQSTPDFDKIAPLCKLYGITADELLTGEKTQIDIEESLTSSNNEVNKSKRAKGIGISILLYFISVIWIMLAIPVLMMNPIVASAIFLIIIGVATAYIVYICTMFKVDKTKEEDKKSKKNKLYKRIEDICALIILIIYLLISFITFAWHITWIIWIIYALIMEIIKLVLTLKGDYDEEE